MVYKEIMNKKYDNKTGAFMDNESLGERIGKLRKEKRLTQAELAQQIHVGQKLISDYELNKLRPNYEIIIKLALALEITTDELLGLKNIKTNGKNKPSKKIIRRMEKIGTLPVSQQKFILRTLDSHLKALEK